MSEHELDRAIEDIRREVVEESVVRGAAKRVFSRVFDSTLSIDNVGRIRGCGDFQALIPGYLGQGLSPARTLLFEDHTRQCVSCRRALQQARAGTPAVDRLETSRLAQSNRRFVALSWALAAALTVGIGIGFVGAQKGLLPGQHAVRATVAAVDGSLYRITAFGSRLVAVGEAIRSYDELRTGKGSRATLRLQSGAQLEVAERSDVSISGNWTGATVNLERGRLILASSPSSGKTYISSGGLVIPVQQAILAVDSGLKGSRVAVAKGEVQVQQGQKATAVAAGHQFASDYRIGAVPISTEFSWSGNAGAYAALLNEFASLQKEFQSIPAPGLRYSSALAKYLPADTAIYAAMPNIGATLVEAKRLFDERLSQSEVLREWWNQEPAAKRAELDRALSQIASLSQYLGDELVLAVPAVPAHRTGVPRTGSHPSGAREFGSPVFVAELRNSGLTDYLRQNVPASAGLRIVTGAAAGGPNLKGELFVATSNNVVVASPDLAALRTVQASIEGSNAGMFVQTPFYGRIAQSYSEGVGYLLAADMEQMEAKSVNSSEARLGGLANVQYLVLDRRETGGSSETRAALSFSATRQGIASWLGSPGPIGSLAFASPDASFAMAFVMKNPRDIATELMTFASQGDAGFADHLSAFESATGVNLVDDLAAPLGGDAMFAVDGPLLPLPTWKFVIEVNDADRLQNALTALVNRYNQIPETGTGKLQFAANRVGPRTFYSLRSEKFPQMAVYYTFVDGYLLASASEATLNQAIQDRQAGHTLVSSAQFRNQLPADNSTNFSGILYTNAGSAVGPVASQLSGSTALSPEQRQSLTAFLNNTAPGLICLYGEPESIVAATRSSFLGFNLGTLVGVQQGKPIVPLIASNALAMRQDPNRSRN